MCCYLNVQFQGQRGKAQFQPLRCIKTNKHKDLEGSHREIFKVLFLPICQESTSHNSLTKDRAKTAIPIAEQQSVDSHTTTATWHTHAPLKILPTNTDNISRLLVFNLSKPSCFLRTTRFIIQTFYMVLALS